MAGISKLAAPFSQEFLNLVLLTGFLVGIVQVIMGLLKMGFLVNILAQPVISGFISAAAFIIIASQFKSSLGIQVPNGQSTFQSLIYVLKNYELWHIPTVIISVISVVFLVVMRRIKKSFPASIVLLVAFIGLSYGLNFGSKNIAIIGEIPNGLPSIYVPQFNFELIKQLLPTVFIVTLIGYIGSVGIAKSFQMKHRNYQVNPNTELIALGFAKIIGTFFQGNLASGSYSRSAINEDAGAKTQLAAVFTMAVILVSLLFLTPFLYYLPKAVLAAIILVSVFSLIKISEAKRYLRVRFDDFAIMLFTFLITLFFSIEIGILAGVLLSYLFLQYRSSKPHIAELVRIPETKYYRNLKRFPNGISNKKYLILRFDDQLYFGNADFFKESIYDYIEARETLPEYLILHATNIHTIDSTGLHTLEDTYKELSEKGIEVLFSGMIGPVRDILTRAGFIETLGAAKQFMNLKDAIEFTKDQNNNTLKLKTPFVYQYNERRFKIIFIVRKWFKN